MTARIRRQVLILVGAALLYLGSYVTYRVTHTEVWVRDGRPYVIFGSRVAYYFYRPLAYVDGAMTDIGFHIGGWVECG